MNKKGMILNFMSLLVCSFQILLTTIAYCIVYNANNMISNTNSRKWAWVKFNTLLFPFGFKYPKAIMVKDKSVNLAISLFHIKELKNDQTWYWVDIPECLLSRSDLSVQQDHYSHNFAMSLRRSESNLEVIRIISALSSFLAGEACPNELWISSPIHVKS